MESTWGIVTSLTPTQVRFSGDVVDSPVAVKNDDVTLTVNDKVCLMRLGVKDGWCIAYVIGVTT